MEYLPCICKRTIQNMFVHNCFTSEPSFISVAPFNTLKLQTEDMLNFTDYLNRRSLMKKNMYQ